LGSETLIKGGSQKKGALGTQNVEIVLKDKEKQMRTREGERGKGLEN